MRKFINIVNEATRPTKLKTATATDMSSLMPAPEAGALTTTGGQPNVRLNRAGSAGTAAALARASQSPEVAAMRANVGAAGGAHALMRDLERMGAQTPDRVSDAQARALAGTTQATLPNHTVDPLALAAPTTDLATTGEPTNPTGLPSTADNLPDVVAAMMHSQADGEVMSRGALALNRSNLPDATFDPEWHMVRDLPAYILNGVRQVARQIFYMWTNTEIEDIQMMCTLLNPMTDVQKMAAWIVNSGKFIKDCNLDFETTMPSYASIAGLAECKIYAAGGYKFLVMRDRGGHYIYGWPEADAVDATPALGGPTGQRQLR